VGDIEVTGLTKKELEAKIKQLISSYVVNPEVNVTILEYRSKVIYVLGEVGRPGKYYLGQPQLRAKLENVRLEQFKQRIAVYYHIYSLSRQETGEYIEHRLRYPQAHKSHLRLSASFGIHRQHPEDRRRNYK